MWRVVTVLCLILCVGCSRVPDTDAVVEKPDGEVEDGGTVENVDRDKVNEYFGALAKVESVDEEKELLTEFGQWLKKNEYKIRVERADGEHRLSCPYMPPVTPWTEHSFLDIKNLELLPHLEIDEKTTDEKTKPEAIEIIGNASYRSPGIQLQDRVELSKDLSLWLQELLSKPPTYQTDVSSYRVE